jgi:hypothetical protein
MSKKTQIKKIALELRVHGWSVTVFSGRNRMPAALKGLPDLYMCKNGVSVWVEVKLRHANYMRDQMHDAQWQWYHDRRDDFGPNLRYAIIENVDELLAWLTVLDIRRHTERHTEPTYIPEYHWERYNQWRRGR